jgi:hypothetical protein
MSRPETLKTLRHGNRTTYVRGCRCEECRAANRAYQHELNDRRRMGEPVNKPLAKVTSLRSEPVMEPEVEQETGPGPVQAAVIAQIATLSAAKRQPGLAESVIAMARIIDNPRLATTHPSAHRQLMAGVDKLAAASVGRKGNLAQIASMSQRDKAVQGNAGSG